MQTNCMRFYLNDAFDMQIDRIPKINEIFKMS